MSELTTRTVAYGARQEFEGLFASGAGEPRPGVLVCHTIRGRTPFEEERATRLAEMGYAALAADVYGIEHIGSDDINTRAQMVALKQDRPLLQDRLRQSLATLAAQPEVDASRLAAIGFCFGGLCVLDIARCNMGAAGVAAFHGLFEPPGNTDGNSIDTKVLALHGWDDPLATPEQVLGLAAEMSAAGADWQLHAYGNTRHAFTNPAANDVERGTIYDAAADRRSWAAMTDFLSELFVA